ncbi:hypothetical protein MBANPS3_004429 [Mucor bainieri]
MNNKAIQAICQVFLRARTIKVLSRYVELEQYFYNNQIEALRKISGGDKDLEEDVAELYEFCLEHSAAKALLNDIRSSRYFLGRGNCVLLKASTVARRLEFLDELDDEGYLEEYRTSKSSFDKLVDFIKDSPAYSKKKPQTPIRVQIAMALEKLGTYGNGTRFGRMRRKYGTEIRYGYPVVGR